MAAVGLPLPCTMVQQLVRFSVCVELGLQHTCALAACYLNIIRPMVYTWLTSWHPSLSMNTLGFVLT